MTVALFAKEIATKLEEQFTRSIVESSQNSLVVNNEFLLAVASFLKTTPGLDFDYLTSITAVDYYDYFEVVYHLTSIKHNHSLVVKTRCYDRDNPSVVIIINCGNICQIIKVKSRCIFKISGYW